MKNSPFKYLFRLPYAGLILALTVLAGLTQGFGLAMFLPLLHIMSGEEAAPGFPFDLIRRIFEFLGLPFEVPVVLTFLVALVLCGLAVTLFQRTLVMAISLMKHVRHTSRRLVVALLDSTWSHISTQSTGETTIQLTTEVMRGGRAMTQLLNAVSAAIQIVALLAFSFAISPQLLLVAAIFGIFAAALILPTQRRSYYLGDLLTQANKRFGFYAVDYLRNMKLIKATASEPETADRITALQDDVCTTMARRQINLALSNFIVQAAPVFLVAIVIGLVTQVLDLQTETALVFLVFMARIAPLATHFQQEYQSFVLERSAIDLIDDMIETHERNAEAAPNKDTKAYHFDHAIRFEDVGFSFSQDSSPALSKIDLDIAKGGYIGIVGASGAGKSTFVDLLCGLRTPTGGRITVDGQDLRDIDIRTWRHQIGYVTQDVVVFNDTLRNNIRFAHPEADDDALDQAIDLANLRAVVDNLPNGLDTVMGEGGVRLSGGQKQRLALARALVGRPQILILDEATSALDSESEQAIQASLDAIAHRFTIVVVAHRLSTIKNADLICVLEKGRIVERGTFAELLAQDGAFAGFYNIQVQGGVGTGA